MAKRYSDRSMTSDAPKQGAPEREYFFPKENPPRVIKAASLREAEEKLQAEANQATHE